jgi:ubiquinone/menaquinone biosynthesis C-methylase UbiE
MDRREYFDGVADKWDGWNARAEMEPVMRQGLRELGVGPEEHVLDLGCGTGIMLGMLLDVLGPRGRVTAVDFAPRMVEVARGKTLDTRVEFRVAEACALPVGDGTMDRCVCFSTWPHFPDPRAVLVEQHRVLKPGGLLHVWHVSGREKINAIHAGVGGVIGQDLLPPVRQLADVAGACGFSVVSLVDNPDRYLLTARRG